MASGSGTSNIAEDDLPDPKFEDHKIPEPQPQGLVTDHSQLTNVIQGDGTQTEEAANTLAWWPAVSLTVGTESIVPMSAPIDTCLDMALPPSAKPSES